MLKLLLCDSDSDFLQCLKKMILEVVQENILISLYKNPETLLESLQNTSQQDLSLVMLNWQIGENDGIELAGKINALRPEARIVFMSDNLERIKDIFHVSPFYFLLKPIEKDYLQDALNRAIYQLHAMEKKTLVLYSGTHKKKALFFQLCNVYYFESDLRKITIHEEKRSISVYQKLQDIESRLSDNFCRCHQSYIVNMDKISKITMRELYLYNGDIIPISRSRKEQVRDQLCTYLSWPKE